MKKRVLKDYTGQSWEDSPQGPVQPAGTDKHRPGQGQTGNGVTGEGFVLASRVGADTGPADSSATEDECAISLKAKGTFTVFKLDTGAKTSRFQLQE